MSFHPRKVGEGVVVREFRDEDVDDIMEMYSLMKWPISVEGMKSWSRKSEYTRVLVAERNEKAVGKVTFDTAYPPYSELVNLVVHPNYRRIGIGSRLIQSCIEVSHRKRCSIISAMAEPNNYSAHRLYSKFGFHIGILPDSKEGRIWLFRFSEDSPLGKFLSIHPFSQPSASLNKISFHDHPLYEMKWIDPLTEDKMIFYLEGQPGQPREGGTMPRIAGISYKEGDIALDCAVHEKSKFIGLESEAVFELLIVNAGRKDLRVEGLEFILPKGSRVLPKKTIPKKLKTEESKTVELKFKLIPNFDVPILSFGTVLTTCCLKFVGTETQFVISAGFERVNNADLLHKR